MAEMQVTVLVCPNCSAPVRQGSKTCDRCYSEYIITPASSLKKHLEEFEARIKSKIRDTGKSAELFTALGICQLQRGLHRHASDFFEKAIAELPEDGETYYYAAIALLGGQRPFLSKMPVIKEVIKYIQLALELTERGHYYYLYHLVHKDYFEKRQLNCSPSSAELLEKSRLHGVDESVGVEISALVGLLS